MTDEQKLQYLLNHCDKIANSCWIWQLCCDEKGYGVVSFRQDNGKHRTFAAHRESLRLHKKEELVSQVLHTCDNKSCINPEHLYQGTHADNVKNTLNQQQYKQDNKHYNSVINEQQAPEVLYRYVGGQRICNIAKDMSLDYGVVKHVAYRKTWKQLEILAL